MQFLTEIPYFLKQIMFETLKYADLLKELYATLQLLVLELLDDLLIISIKYNNNRYLQSG